MSKPKDSILLNEYQQLAASYVNIESNALKANAVVISLILALTAFRNVNTNFFDFVIPFAISFLFIWIGICHSMANYYGLRLVTIEQTINEQLPIDSPDKLSFYTEYISEGSNVIGGLKTYFVLIAALVLIGFGVSLWQSWQLMSNLQWPFFLKFIGIATPLLMTIVALGNMVLVERRTRKTKMKLRQRSHALHRHTAAPKSEA
jgi:hypothetical protein